MQNKIKLDYEKNQLLVYIHGDWDSFVKPIKNKLKSTAKYIWDNKNKYWYTKIRGISYDQIKENLKQEFRWLKDNFNGFLDISIFKEKVIELKSLYEEIEKNIDNDLKNLPDNIKKELTFYQKEGVVRFNRQMNSILLGWQMGCLSGDTSVIIIIGNLFKRIKIKFLYKKWNEYENVLFIRGFNFNENVFKFYKLNDIVYSGRKETIKLIFSNNLELICTKDHKIYTDKGWINADKITRKDNVYSYFYTLKKIKLVKKEYNGIIDTYDLSVEKSNCFVANNILVHNSGKTLGSLAIVKSKNKKGIIISPKSLMEQWREEILKWEITTDDKVFLFGEKKKFLISGYDFYIINYEKFIFLSKKTQYKGNNKIIHDWLESIINYNDYILIFDEMYKIKNYKSLLHKGTKNLKNNYNWCGVIGLSGTPQENSLMEFYTVLNFIQPGCITWVDMEKHFIHRVNRYVMKFRNFKLFNKRASVVMHRILKEDIKKDLPKLTQLYRFVDHDREAHELFNILKEDEESTIFSIYTTLRVIDSYLKPHEGLKKYDLFKDYIIEHKNKYNELVNVLKEIGDEQVLIFTSFSTTMNWLIEKLKKDGYKNIIGVDGSVSRNEKERIKKAFIDGEYKIVIATDVWNRGVDLPTINYIINWDFPLNPATYSQRRDRIHRMNSTEPKMVISLISDVIERSIYNIVKNKIKSAEQSVDGISKDDILQVLAKKWGMK